MTVFVAGLLAASSLYAQNQKDSLGNPVPREKLNRSLPPLPVPKSQQENESPRINRNTRPAPPASPRGGQFIPYDYSGRGLGLYGYYSSPYGAPSNGYVYGGYGTYYRPRTAELPSRPVGSVIDRPEYGISNGGTDYPYFNWTMRSPRYDYGLYPAHRPSYTGAYNTVR